MTADQVECYSGHTYGVEPRALVWLGARHPVVDLVARWRTPAGPAFRVRTAAGDLFDLAHDDARDEWTITPLPEAPAVRRGSGHSSPTMLDPSGQAISAEAPAVRRGSGHSSPTMLDPSS